MAQTLTLIGSLVIAGLAARFAVHQAIVANAYVDHRLAQAAKFLALARSFRHFTLGAFVAGRTSSGAHSPNLSRSPGERKMTSVMVVLQKGFSQQSTIINRQW